MMKKIPKKNYIIVLIITLATLIGLYALVKIYSDSKTLNEENYLDYLSQIMPEELENYLIENHDCLIYITDSELTNKEIDIQVKKALENNNYVNETVYINLNGIDDSAYDKISSYGIEKTRITSNTFVIIRNSKAVKTINLNSNNVKRLKDYIVNFYED